MVRTRSARNPSTAYLQVLTKASQTRDVEKSAGGFDTMLEGPLSRCCSSATAFDHFPLFSAHIDQPVYQIRLGGPRGLKMRLRLLDYCFCHDNICWPCGKLGGLYYA
jgi:hypothetical protein